MSLSDGSEVTDNSVEGQIRAELTERNSYSWNMKHWYEEAQTGRQERN